MGKKAIPKVAIDAKNHMENHNVWSVSVLPNIFVSSLYINLVSIKRLIEFTAKVYKFFHSAS